MQVSRTGRAFTEFVEAVEPRLSYALGLAYGVETGREATADALAYAWEHWDRVSGLENAPGYLFRVGQSSARRYRKRPLRLPRIGTSELPDVEPGLPVALESLSGRQRSIVVLVHGQGFSEREVAELLGISRGTVRKHAERGLEKLRRQLGGDNGA